MLLASVGLFVRFSESQISISVTSRLLLPTSCQTGGPGDGRPRPPLAANGTFPLNLPLIGANVSGPGCEGTDQEAALVLFAVGGCETKPVVNVPHNKHVISGRRPLSEHFLLTRWRTFLMRR